MADRGGRRRTVIIAFFIMEYTEHLRRSVMWQRVYIVVVRILGSDAVHDCRFLWILQWNPYNSMWGTRGLSVELGFYRLLLLGIYNRATVKQGSTQQ